jgi:hypothetical protein
MPLSPQSSRELIHTRHVDCRGYRRADGLWDIEGHLTDVKSYAFESQDRGAVPAGEPVHDMWVRLTLDDELVIGAIEAVTDRSPFAMCGAITVNFQRLKGLAIRAGFLGRVRELLGGIEGCTHLVELMGPVATTAFQTIYPYRDRLRRQQGGKELAPPAGKRPALLGTCHAFASDSPVVERLWPDFFTGR